MKLKQVQTIETFAQGMFRQKDVLRNFAKFTGKHLCQRLYFNKFADLRLQLSLKRDSVTGVFLCIFGKFLRTHFLTEHLLWLLLKRKTKLFPWPGWYVNDGGFLGLCQFTRHDPTIHDPTMHDSCINYANMLTLYRDKS